MEKNWKYEDEELLEKEFQTQVMEMKQKYEEIPVPAHARDRMLAGIRQAKEEKERSVSGVISLEDRKGRKKYEKSCMDEEDRGRGGRRSGDSRCPGKYQSGNGQCHGKAADHRRSGEGDDLPDL